MENNLVYLVKQLLKKNEINFDKEELSFQIQSHPSYPSLHAITGVLTHFNVDNIALQVPVNEETLAELPKHFIAQIKIENGEDFVTVSNDGLDYDILFGDKKKARYSIHEFLDKFTGILVAVEKDETQETTQKRPNYLRKGLIVIAILTLLVFWVVSNRDLSISIFLVTALIGVYVSYAIYKQEQGEKTSLGEAFCSGETKKSDCDSVISSNGATLFGILKLSDLSLLYFVGLAVLTYLIGVSNLAYTLPYAIGLFAVTITIYSLYYQAFVAKAWCGLCLSIVGILWIQAAIVLFNMDTITAFSFDVSEILLTLISFTVITVIWLLLKPNLESLKELKEEKIKYFKFKRNFNLFNTLLEKTDRIATTITSNSEIVFGKKENTLPIVVITNPFCGHCKAVHTLVEDIYKKYGEQTAITIRFNISVKDTESDVVKITSRLIELYHTEEIESCMGAMHEIYGGKEAKSWLTKWGACKDPETYISILKQESDWCQQNNINFTPEILVAGYSYPKEYERNDLVFFIEELQENYMEGIETNTPLYQTV